MPVPERDTSAGKSGRTSGSIAPAAKTAVPVCPYCGAASQLQVRAPDINRRISDIVFELRACFACGLMFVTNPPDDIGIYYKSDYYSLPKTAADLEPHLKDQQFKLDLTKAYKPGGELLEIGPAIGMFCLLAKRGGFSVSAIEFDADCVKYIQKELGIRAVQSTDPAATMVAEGRTYDAICLWHVIEHLAEPWNVLDVAVAHLNPGGILVIAAPNPHAWQARVLGRHWPHYDLPRHLFQLPIPWLTSYAASAGMSVHLVTTRDEGSLYWNRFTWAMLLRRLITWRRIQERLWTVGLRIGRMLDVWEGKEGRGATYTVVLQRSDGVRGRSDTAAQTAVGQGS